MNLDHSPFRRLDHHVDLCVVDNVRRQVTLALNERTAGLRLVLEETHGAPQCRVYGFIVRSTADEA